MPDTPIRWPTFSIILPAYNEAAHVGRCLASLDACQGREHVAGIVLVDNGSTDDTVALAKEAGARVIEGGPGPRCTIAALRNRGAAAATGEILVFLDADMLVPPHWLAAAARHYGQGFEGILGFVDRAPQTAALVARAFGDRLFRKRRAVMSVDYLPGRNLFVPAGLFARLGGFDADLPTAEDKDLTLRAARIGAPVLSSPEAPVVHLGCERGFFEFVRKEYWRQGHTLDLLRKEGLSLRALRNPLLSLYHLLVPLLALVAAVSGRPLAALALAAAWIAPGAVLAARDVGLGDPFYPVTALLVFSRWVVSGLALLPQLAALVRRPVGPGPASPGLAVTRLAGFDEPGLAGEWDALLTDCADDSLFVTREWLASWWRVYGRGELWLLAVREGGCLVGLAALYRAPCRLAPGLVVPAWRLVGDEAVGTDFAMLPARRGREAAVMAAVLDVLGGQPPAGLLVVRDAPLAGPGLTALVGAARARGWAVTRGRRSACPVLVLPRDMDAFQAAPDPTFKAIVRKTRKHLARRPGVAFDLAAAPADLDAWLDGFFAANTGRWQAEGRPGAFASPEKRTFYRLLARAARERGWLRLAEVVADGAPAAMEFDLLRGGVLYNLQMATTQTGRKLRAGNALRHALIETLIAEGAREFDMLRGAEPYKYQWGATDRFTADVLVWRGIRGRLALAGWAAYRGAKALGRLGRKAVAAVRDRLAVRRGAGAS